MINPQEIYHWAGVDAYTFVLEAYECLPEENPLCPVVLEDQDYE